MLKFTMTNVDLAAVDALLLRPRAFQRCGRRHGHSAGHPAGAAGQPPSSSEQGELPEVSVETFAAWWITKAGADGRCQVQQNATQWITAQGYVPRALFTPSRRRPAPSAADHHGVVASEDRIDLTIDAARSIWGDQSSRHGDRRQGNARATSCHRVSRGSASTRRDAVRDGSLRSFPAGGHRTEHRGPDRTAEDRVHIDHITLLDITTAR